ncbi:MAG: ATP-binding protein, partial [Gammaproteobacteria bacterium]
SLACWNGAALEEFSSESWAQPVARRFEELRANALLSRAEARLRLGFPAEAIVELQSLIADYPLRDRPRGLLMEALACAGRRTEALRAFQQYRQLLGDEVGTEPGRDVCRIDADIAAGLIGEGSFVDRSGGRPEGATARPVNGWLPQLPTTTFVGRQGDCEAVAVDLKASRIVTVTGVGGVGKTRLAIEVAQERILDWAEGVRFVDLTRAAQSDDVVAVVREALGVSSTSCSSAHELVDAIRSADLLLVLDNCEHVVAEAASMVELIASNCAHVAVLATSREALGVTAECVYLLEPLAPAAEAVDLFVDRAEAADRSFRFDDETRPVVHELCETLEGLPFAIELAAARVRSLSVHDIAARLHDGFSVLSGVRRTSVEHHRSLTAMFTWSFDLLTETEQRALLWLAIFVQGFSLSDAERMLGDTEAAGTLAALVEKSMVVRIGGGTTYRLLQPMRQCCREYLVHREELDEAHADHAGYVLAEMPAAVADVHGADSIHGTKRVRSLFPELRAAARWAVAADRLDLALDLSDAVESVFVLDIDLGGLAGDVYSHPNAHRHPRSLLVDGFVLHDRHLRGTPLPVDEVRQLIDRFVAGEPSSAVAAFGAMTLSYQGHHVEAIEAADRIRSVCQALEDSPSRRYSLQATCYLTGKGEYLDELRRTLDDASHVGSAYWIGCLGMSLAHVLADTDSAEARETLLSCVGSALDVDVPLLAQTSLVLYVALVVLEAEPPPLDTRMSAALARELARAPSGYRLRAHHFFVLSALMIAANHYDLAAECLAAYDALGTRSSARSQAMIDSARTIMDDRLASAGVQPAPVAKAETLASLAGRLEEVLTSS